jgi:outer membrane lipoprotein-sorting protein
MAERPTRDEMFRRLQSSREAYTSLKGLGKYRFQQQDKSFSATQAMFVQQPDRLRIETLGLFGAPALMLTTDGLDLTALLPGEAKAYQGKSDSGLLQQFIRLPLRDEDIVSILLQQPILTAWDDDTIRYDPNGNSALILKNAYGIRQEILFDLQLNILRFDFFLADGLQMRLTYDNFEEKSRFPRSLKLELPLDELTMSFDFSDVELNITIPDERFKLIPPTSYSIIPLGRGE